MNEITQMVDLHHIHPEFIEDNKADTISKFKLMIFFSLELMFSSILLLLYCSFLNVSTLCVTR